jgi:hypothetical protein
MPHKVSFTQGTNGGEPRKDKKVSYSHSNINSNLPRRHNVMTSASRRMVEDKDDVDSRSIITSDGLDEHFAQATQKIPPQQQQQPTQTKQNIPTDTLLLTIDAIPEGKKITLEHCRYLLSGKQ